MDDEAEEEEEEPLLFCELCDDGNDLLALCHSCSICESCFLDNEFRELFEAPRESGLCPLCEEYVKLDQRECYDAVKLLFAKQRESERARIAKQREIKATNRRVREQRKWQREEEERLARRKKVAAANLDAVDLDIDDIDELYQERLKLQPKPRPQMWRHFKPSTLLRYNPSLYAGGAGRGKRRKMVLRTALIEIGDIYEARLPGGERPESGKSRGSKRSRGSGVRSRPASGTKVIPSAVSGHGGPTEPLCVSVQEYAGKLFGLKSLADDHLASLVEAVARFAPKSARCRLFGVLCGVVDPEMYTPIASSLVDAFLIVLFEPHLVKEIMEAEVGKGPTWISADEAARAVKELFRTNNAWNFTHIKGLCEEKKIPMPWIAPARSALSDGIDALTVTTEGKGYLGVRLADAERVVDLDAFLLLAIESWHSEHHRVLRELEDLEAQEEDAKQEERRRHVELLKAARARPFSEAEKQRLLASVQSYVEAHGGVQPGECTSVDGDQPPNRLLEAAQSLAAETHRAGEDVVAEDANDEDALHPAELAAWRAVLRGPPKFVNRTPGALKRMYLHLKNALEQKELKKWDFEQRWLWQPDWEWGGLELVDDADNENSIFDDGRDSFGRPRQADPQNVEEEESEDDDDGEDGEEDGDEEETSVQDTSVHDDSVHNVWQYDHLRASMSTLPASTQKETMYSSASAPGLLAAHGIDRVDEVKGDAHSKNREHSSLSAVLQNRSFAPFARLPPSNAIWLSRRRLPVKRERDVHTKHRGSLSDERVSALDVKSLDKNLLHREELDGFSLGVGVPELPSVTLEPKNSIVDLRHYASGERGGRALADALRGRSEPLETLALEEMALRDKSCADVLSAVQPAHRLRRLNLVRNRAGDRAVAAIAEGIFGSGALGFLVELDLSNNRLGNARAVTVCEALLNHASLATLALSSNSIGGMRATEALAKLLRQNKALQHLSLAWNLIARVSVEPITSALEQNSTLQSLDLQFNRLEDAGGALVAAALGSNDSLRVLDVSYNGITRATCAALREALKHNLCLNWFGFSGNQVGPAGVRMLVEAKLEGHLRNELDLSLNDNGDDLPEGWVER